MRQLARSVKTFLTSEDGPTSVEYCVMMAFIMMICIVAIGELGTTTNNLYKSSAKEIIK